MKSPREGFTDPSGVNHFSGSSDCTNVGTLAEGDKLYIEAFYDSSKALTHDGKLANFMAVIFMYIGLGGPCDKGACNK